MTWNTQIQPGDEAPRRMLALKRLLPVSAAAAAAFTAPAAAASLEINTSGAGGADTMQLLFLFAVIALAPTLLLMMTSFTRIVIVFSLLRNAIGLQQTPPNQVLIGLALALSLFIMSPVLGEINEAAIEPLNRGEITQQQALDNMQQPIKVFMLKQTRSADLNLFCSLDGQEELDVSTPENLTELPLHVVVPSFVTSELKRAFTMGFLLYLPFLVIDMVVSSTLMSMGMVMLPPSMISLPFKLMLFVVVNGWSRVMEMLVSSFY